MSVFNKYNVINYPFTINGETVYKRVADITTNVRLSQETMKNCFNYEYMTMNNGDTPEIVSDKRYDTVDYYYLLMMCNDQYDWREFSPLTPNELDSMIQEKYSDPNAVHHFEDLNGNRIDNIFSTVSTSDDSFAYPKNIKPITNYDHEVDQNEKKRQIKTISSKYISTVNQLVEEKLS